MDELAGALRVGARERCGVENASSLRRELADLHPKSFGWALACCRYDRLEAEDVLQEAFLQVWRRANDFEEARGRAFTWLVTIARSRALDRLRAAGSRGRLAHEAAQLPREDVGDAATDALRSEEGRAVRQALADLPDEQRRPLLLAYFEGLTQAEIAARLGDPLGTVKTRMRAGMIKLRAILRARVSN